MSLNEAQILGGKSPNGLFTDTTSRIGAIMKSKDFFSQVIPLDSPTDHVKLRAFTDGNNIPYICEIPKNQDVVDIVAYVKKDGNIYIATVSNVRPGPIIHDFHQNGGSHISHQDFIELPAGIIRADLGETELTTTAQRIASEKLGISDFESVFHLGGVRSHSSGKTTELTYPIALRISKIPEPSNQANNDLFQAWAQVEWRSLDDVVLGYLDGKIQDTRLITAVFDIAEKEKFSLKSPSFNVGVSLNYTKLPDGFTILDASCIGENQTDEISGFGEIDYRNLQKPFLSVKKYEITTKGDAGKMSNIQADVSSREMGNDAADCAAYILINNIPYLVVTFQNRPNLLLRDQEYHPIFSEHGTRIIHGISRVIDKGDTVDTIKIKLRERMGGVEFRNIMNIGNDYPSAGHSAERVTRFLGEVAPKGVEGGDCVYIMSVDEIGRMGKRGEILDSRLILNAHIVRHALGYKTLDDFTDSDIQGYEQMVRSGSRVFAGLTSSDKKLRDLHIHCLQYPEYRKRILYAEQELGAAQFDFTDKNEEGFFDASIPVFANPKKVTPENAELYLLYLLHDFDHYRMGEFIPWYKDQAGDMRIYDKEIYQKLMAWTEAEAVFYSDVVTPNFIGIERFESIINPKNNPEIISLGRAFRDMGIDMETARQVILEIERDGIIPDIIKRSEKFPEFRNLFIHRMIRFHVLDYYQAGFEYEWWKSHAHVAEVMLRFGITNNNPEEFVHGFDSSKSMLDSYKEGFNPLRAELARMINIDIRILALKIAFVMDCSSGNTHIQKWANRQLNELEEIQSLLKGLMSGVKNTSTSVSNLKAYKQIQPLKNTIESIGNSIAQPGFTVELSPEQQESFNKRIFPYFKPYESLDPEQEPLKSILKKWDE